MASAAGERPEPWEEQLLGELRALARVADPVPPGVTFAAVGSLAWRRVDAELAELTFDSLLEDAALAGVRSASTVRLVTFEAGEVVVEVEITDAGDRRRLIGQLVPPQVARVEIRTQDSNHEVDADELGRFAADGLPSGPASLRCRLSTSGQVVETGWVVL
jgi:hypothetical protein